MENYQCWSYFVKKVLLHIIIVSISLALMLSFEDKMPNIRICRIVFFLKTILLPCMLWQSTQFITVCTLCRFFGIWVDFLAKIVVISWWIFAGQLVQFELWVFYWILLHFWFGSWLTGNWVSWWSGHSKPNNYCLKFVQLLLGLHQRAV